MSLAMQGTGATPGYSQSYPSRSVRLAAVKSDIFNPRLPKIRHMDRDSSMHLLPDEHSRTSTTLGPVDFGRSTSSVLQPARFPLHSLHITDQGRKLVKYGPDMGRGRTMSTLNQQRELWRDDITRTPSKFSVEMRENNTSKEGPTFSGYAMRYMRPEITSSWQYTLQQQPRLDQYGQRPVPANIFARYRDTHPQYARDAAMEGWR